MMENKTVVSATKLRLVKPLVLIGVGAQSTLGARHFCPIICAEKNNEMPEFYIILARKQNISPFPSAVSYAYHPVAKHRCESWTVKKTGREIYPSL